MILPKPVLPVSPLGTDTKLVRRARDGDIDAQGELVRQFRRPAYLLALQLTGNPDEAMDVTQDALLRFLTHLDRFDAKRPVRPWLYQIVRNRVLDLRRRKRVRRHESLDAVEDGKPRPEVIDEKANPERDAAHAQLRSRVWRALEHLTAAQREILVLRDYQDLSYAEIAAALRIPLGTVMSRLHGARKRLRNHLEDDLQTLHLGLRERSA